MLGQRQSSSEAMFGTANYHQETRRNKQQALFQPYTSTSNASHSAQNSEREPLWKTPDRGLQQHRARESIVKARKADHSDSEYGREHNHAERATMLFAGSVFSFPPWPRLTASSSRVSAGEETQTSSWQTRAVRLPGIHHLDAGLDIVKQK